MENSNNDSNTQIPQKNEIPKKRRHYYINKIDERESKLPTAVMVYLVLYIWKKALK
jgi:hypothetical protein